ncbi:MAG TPA: MetS family NSS transporter small subunit [Acidobacteriota bacterium]|nr:MetS family NSS transporter small subunit [Acidobacteriota bacterium]
MTPVAIITMLLVTGIVWGGFLAALYVVMKKEKRKTNKLRGKAVRDKLE